MTLAWYAKNKSRVIAASAARRRANLKEYNAYQRAWAKANPEKVRRKNIKTLYGISVSEYDAILSAQGGGRAICHTKDWGLGRATRPCVDHDHATGRVRGVLCKKCNLALGAAADSPDRLRAMAEYLERTKGVSE